MPLGKNPEVSAVLGTPPPPPSELPQGCADGRGLQLVRDELFRSICGVMIHFDTAFPLQPERWQLSPWALPEAP